MIFTKIGEKFVLLEEAIKNPKLFWLWSKGIPVGIFLRLNQLWLFKADINTIFDIGANVGLFSSAIHQVLPKATIYSFEPLEDCYKALKRRMRNTDNFTSFNIALGNTEGELEFHRNVYSASSSILPMAELHKQNYPFTAKEHLIKVKVARLDDIAENLEIKNNILIKIDVQGFEDKVLQGGINTIKLASILILETSFQSLYLGQPIFEDIYDILKEDFIYMGALDQSQSSIDGSILQQDSIFLKRIHNI